MIILITGWFDKYNNGIATGEKEFCVSHAVDSVTGEAIITDNFNPIHNKDCYYSKLYGEWVMDDTKERFLND